MASYSIDLRQKIPRACERQLGSQSMIADVFGISLAFVAKVFRQYHVTSDITPKPHADGQTSRLDAAAFAGAQRLVGELPDATRAELCPGMATEAGMPVSLPTMYRAAALGLAASKKSLHASDRDMLLVQQELADYREGIALLDLELLRFIDESGINLAMIRQYERATQGERHIGVIPCTTVSICRGQAPSDPTHSRRS